MQLLNQLKCFLVCFPPLLENLWLILWRSQKLQCSCKRGSCPEACMWTHRHAVTAETCLALAGHRVRLTAGCGDIMVAALQRSGHKAAVVSVSITSNAHDPSHAFCSWNAFVCLHPGQIHVHTTICFTVQPLKGFTIRAERGGFMFSVKYQQTATTDGRNTQKQQHVWRNNLL